MKNILKFLIFVFVIFTLSGCMIEYDSVLPRPNPHYYLQYPYPHYYYPYFRYDYHYHYKPIRPNSGFNYGPRHR